MRTYANVGWTVGDVQSLFDVTEEQALAFLDRNAKHLRDCLVERGWEVMQTLGDQENLTRGYEPNPKNPDE